MGKRKRVRRSFTPEFKAEAVKVVQQSDKSVAMVARDLDLTETALRCWVDQAAVDAGRGPGGALTTDERAELTQLRREIKTLRMERDILKKATAFFAKEQG
jgi:transposase